jgi:hypothetical protein
LAEPWVWNQLGHRRLVTVVLRLNLDPHGELIHGEVVDEVNRLQGRFASWDHLVPALTAWLKRERAGGEPPPPADPGASETKERPCP